MDHGRLNDDYTVQHIRALFFGWGLPMNAVDVFGSDPEVLAKVTRPNPQPPVAVSQSPVP
jgi:hypothetical protein